MFKPQEKVLGVDWASVVGVVAWLSVVIIIS